MLFRPLFDSSQPLGLMLNPGEVCRTAVFVSIGNFYDFHVHFGLYIPKNNSTLKKLSSLQSSKARFYEVSLILSFVKLVTEFNK